MNQNDNNPTNPMPSDILNQILGELRRTNARFDQLETRFDRFETRFNELETRFNELEQEVRASRLETKPIWERALADIAELRAEFGEFKSEVRREFRDLKFRANQDERERLLLEQRIDNLEENQKPKQ